MMHMHIHRLPHTQGIKFYTYDAEPLPQSNAIELHSAKSGNAVALNLRCSEAPRMAQSNFIIIFYGNSRQYFEKHIFISCFYVYNFR